MTARENADTVETPFIPDHHMVCRIGKGAYGEVWLARNVLGTYRGVKIVRRATFDDDRPFERELEGIKRFEPISRSHPGFVSILQVGRNEAEHWFYYVMEVADDAAPEQQINPKTYIPRTLSEEMKQRGRLPVAECAQIGIELSAALACLHRQGLIHRDIKPSNIIYIRGTPRLADVGLVATVREHASWVGTVGFIPSEGPGTPCADVFALGMVLYQIAAGHSVKKFPDLPSIVFENSDGLQFARFNRVILKACAANPRDRYQTADELHNALAALLEPESKPGQASLLSNRPMVRSALRERRITLLYQANVDLDSRLLHLLQSRLVARGIDVYFDQRLTVGVQWAREIENKISDADAVVILLSPASVQSEMLAYEIEMAHHAAQQRAGRPLRLPVRVQFKDAWPDTLRPFLDPLHSFSWNGPEDDDQLVSELVRTLETTHQQPFPAERTRIEPYQQDRNLNSLGHARG